MKVDNDNIERTLASLDSLEEVNIKPFFYTRLRTRLDSKQTLSKRQMAVGWAALIVLMAVNTGVLLSLQGDSINNSATYQIEVLNNEYYTNTNDFYTLIEEYETE